VQCLWRDSVNLISTLILTYLLVRCMTWFGSASSRFLKTWQVAKTVIPGVKPSTNAVTVRIGLLYIIFTDINVNKMKDPKSQIKGCRQWTVVPVSSCCHDLSRSPKLIAIENLYVISYWKLLAIQLGIWGAPLGPSGRARSPNGSSFIS